LIQPIASKGLGVEDHWSKIAASDHLKDVEEEEAEDRSDAALFHFRSTDAIIDIEMHFSNPFHVAFMSERKKRPLGLRLSLCVAF